MTQAAFARALLDPAAPPPAELVAWNGSDVGVRFAVYRNNVVASLIEALADTYPVVQQLVGREFFRAMARAWIAEHLPTSAVLARYGAGFPEFMATFPPAATVPYLADVARLEWAYVQAFHAENAATATPEDIAAALAVPERLPVLRLVLHPSLMTFASPYAIVSLWVAHQGGEVSALPDPYQPEAALVLRPELQVRVVRIDVGTHALVRALQDGAPLGEAASAALSAHADFDLTQALALLIREQAISTLAA